jgi:ParB family chromosome partitioning protein
MNSQSRRPVLGRGLSALIPDAGGAPPAERPVAAPLDLPIDEIRPAQDQPRTVFDDAAIDELAASIRENGIIQPVIVRQVAPHEYVLIAGERRWRAAGRVGLRRMPVVVRDVTPDVAYQLALIENVQRQDLRPLEEAEAYQHLLQTAQLTQEELARRVGKDRATVANALRLLRLPADLRVRVESGVLTPGHIRALLTVPDETIQRQLAVRIESEGWSVRETERQARAARRATEDGETDIVPDVPVPGTLPGPESNPDHARSRPTETGRPAPSPAQTSSGAPHRRSALEAVEQQLRTALGAPVTLVHRGGAGRIEIKFHSLDELDRLVDLIGQLEGL